MASYLDKFKVKVGIDDNTKLDLSCQHITTADFMQLAPVYCKEMVPGETLRVNQETFTRLAPMPVPTFGRANVHNRGFFVPYRTVWKGWNDFITDTRHVGSQYSPGGAINSTAGIFSQVPYFTMGNLIYALVMRNDSTGDMFVQPRNNGVGSGQRFVGSLRSAVSDTNIPVADVNNIVGPNVASDLWIASYPAGGVFPSGTDYNALTDILGVKWNAKGRQIMKILNSLGYQVTGDYSMQSVKMSALPLLAYLKVYLDWYYPAAYYGDATYTVLDSILNYDPAGSDYEIGYLQLFAILNLLSFVNYDSDYFVSAFDNPEGPNTDAASTVTLYDPSNGSGNSATSNAAISNANRRIVSFPNPSNNMVAPNTPLITGLLGDSDTARGLSTISQYALNALKSLTDYMKRHQLVGARAMDRYLARFGKSLSAEKLNRSLYLNHMSFGLQIGDIMSQSDTAGAQLGDYAGKGLGFGQANYEHSTDEYGMFIITSSIVPTVGYYQGIDRTILHLGKLDFWTPEFDQLGNQAISKAELFINTKNPTIMSGLDSWNGIFGYTPRYAEYKVGRDRLTGDFRVNTLTAAGDTSNSWHLMREFDASSFGYNSNNVKHSKEFVEGEDQSQYNRIFYNTDNSADHFVVIHNFSVMSMSPMCSLYDTYEFDSKGKSVTADVNGVKVN